MFKKILAMLIVAGMSGATAWADPSNQASTVEFHALTASSQESAIVRQLYAPFLSRHPDVRMSTAVVDLG